MPFFLNLRLIEYLNIEKRRASQHAFHSNQLSLLIFLHLREAVAAKYRTVFTGTERNSRLTAAIGTGGREHFTVRLGSVLPRIPAALASLGLVYKALFRIELLFASGEHELLSAFLTD